MLRIQSKHFELPFPFCRSIAQPFDVDAPMQTTLDGASPRNGARRPFRPTRCSVAPVVQKSAPRQAVSPGGSYGASGHPLIALRSDLKVVLAAQPVDFRKSVHSLSALVPTKCSSDWCWAAVRSGGRPTYDECNLSCLSYSIADLTRVSRSSPSSRNRFDRYARAASALFSNRSKASCAKASMVTVLSNVIGQFPCLGPLLLRFKLSAFPLNDGMIR